MAPSPVPEGGEAAEGAEGGAEGAAANGPCRDDDQTGSHWVEALKQEGGWAQGGATIHVWIMFERGNQVTIRTSFFLQVAGVQADIVMHLHETAMTV